MIAASILFKLPLTTDWVELRKKAQSRAETFYQDLPGLHTKAFVLDESTGEYGGLYIWESREQLDTFLNSDTFKSSRELFGTPEIKIFDLVAHIEHGKLV
jgi:hypothetical protein